MRNPYSRLLSVYLDKIAGMRIAGTGFDIVARACAVARPADVSFERFIRYLEDGGLWKNPHWAPQVSMIPVKVSRLAFVGRVESLEQDLAAVVDRLFGEGTFMSVQTRMDGRTHAAKRLGEYYDDELTRRVQVLYREDFEAFSYPFDWRLIDS